MVTDERSGGRPTTVSPGSMVPPPCSTRSSATRWAARACSSVSTPRSLRLDASDGSLCRRTLRPIVGGSKCAASMTMSVVFSSISTWAAAHDAGDADRSAVVGDQQIVGVEGADDVVEGGDLLAGLGAADDDVALKLGPVVGVVGLAELEHDVVADVDGERDRAHAGLLDAAGHPGGRRA